jgi:prepilin-type processing-associated H-X9-DG protein
MDDELEVGQRKENIMANYTIIGSDGREYGPVSASDLRKWVAEGRADAQSKVRAEGATEWVTLATVPELGGVQKATSPPPLPANLPSATGKMSAMAVLSLVLGILGLFTCGGTALFGLILGIIAMVKVSNSQGALRGKGLALAGTIVSGVFLLMLPVFAAMLLPALAAAKQKAMEISCMNNERQLTIAVRMYSAQNMNHFPPAATWCDAIKASAGSEKVFKCPAANASSRCDYAFNAKLDGLDAGKVDPQTVMIFESDAGWNANGGPEIASAQHHRNVLNVAFADGHVERVAETRLNSLRWDP